MHGRINIYLAEFLSVRQFYCRVNLWIVHLSRMRHYAHRYSMLGWQKLAWDHLFSPTRGAVFFTADKQTCMLCFLIFVSPVWKCQFLASVSFCVYSPKRLEKKKRKEWWVSQTNFCWVMQSFLAMHQHIFRQLLTHLSGFII